VVSAADESGFMVSFVDVKVVDVEDARARKLKLTLTAAVGVKLKTMLLFLLTPLMMLTSMPPVAIIDGNRRKHDGRCQATTITPTIERIITVTSPSFGQLLYTFLPLICFDAGKWQIIVSNRSGITRRISDAID
jgi:hypothetical protein